MTRWLECINDCDRYGIQYYYLEKGKWYRLLDEEKEHFVMEISINDGTISPAKFSKAHFRVVSDLENHIAHMRKEIYYGERA